jgi:hypothetical protein
MFLAGEFKEAYANAKLYAVKEVAHDQVDFKDMKFDGGKYVQLPFFKVHIFCSIVWGVHGPDSFENGDIKAWCILPSSVLVPFTDGSL